MVSLYIHGKINFPDYLEVATAVAVPHGAGTTSSHTSI